MPRTFRVSPFPDAKRFAVTFVDDTDLSTRANTEPVYDFLRAHHVFGTKTVWPLEPRRTSSFRLRDERPYSGPSPGASLEDPDYLDFVVRLKESGFDIGLHGVSAGNTRRDEIIEGLARFRATFGCDPAINAFHQTNIENLYAGAKKLDSLMLRVLECLGHGSEYLGDVANSPYFWGDIARSVFRYVRLPFHTIARVNTLRVCPLMPFHDARRPHVREWFACSDGADVHRFVRLLSEENLTQLERQGGACIVYTHFAKGFAPPGGHSGRLAPAFVAAIERLVARPRGWFPTAVQLLDRLAAWRQVSLVHDEQRIVVRNEGPEPVCSLTLLGAPGVDLFYDTGVRVAQADATSWSVPPLGAGDSVAFRTSRFGRYVVPARKHRAITRREHRAIEYSNYFGLVKGIAIARVGRSKSQD